MIGYLAQSGLWLATFMTGAYVAREAYEEWKRSLPWQL